MSKSSPWSQGGKAPTVRKENVQVTTIFSIQKRNRIGNGTKSPEKGDSSQQAKRKRERRQLLANCVWLPGRMHIEERGTIEQMPRLLNESENKKIKQIDYNTAQTGGQKN